MAFLSRLKPPTLSLLQLLCLAAVRVNGGWHDSPRPCKVVPGDTDWPAQESWARFNESLGGGLLQPAPAGAVCHPGQRTYDPEKCPAVAAGWADYDFHSSDPTSVQWNQFSNESCLPDERYPCDGSGYPAFVVNATEVEHVQLAVDFARDNDVRLIIKGTGHDYIGRSIAPNSLSIWTHHMKGIEYHEGSFTPAGCSESIEGNAVTAQAGVQMMDLYEYLHAYKETVVGGGSKTVGVGGYLTGGGHSMLSSRNGLAADQVLEAEVVTPDGAHIVANECQNEDVFWAVRGGGGSTFGVLTSVTLRTIPSPKMLHMLFSFGTASTAPNIPEIQALFLSKVPELSDGGASGYVWISNALENPEGENSELPELAGVFGLLTLQDTDDEEDMLALMNPIVEEAAERYLESNVTFGPLFEKYDSFLEWFEVYWDQSPAGQNTWMGSRLLDEEALTGNFEQLAANLERLGDTMDTMSLMVHLVAGKGVQEAEPRGGGNAVLPAWRKAYAHSLTATMFLPRNETDDARARDRIESAVEILEEMAPESGAYINEAYVYQHNWQHTFWGENYDRLLAIKRAVDPEDVLWCHPCVGSEGWQEIDGRLCRVGEL
ncbi:hypothetical protein VUR80DRAFT_8269 [Thermomyces stellatus]